MFLDFLLNNFPFHSFINGLLLVAQRAIIKYNWLVLLFYRTQQLSLYLLDLFTFTFLTREVAQNIF